VQRFSFADLAKPGPHGHILKQVLAGSKLYKGGVSFHSPGHVSHDDERPHIETDQEAFVLLQGSGWIEIDGVRESASAGDVILIEPEEDHHLISSEDDPFVILWLHAE